MKRRKTYTYLLMSGDYSDTQIHAAFSNQQKAVAIIDFLNLTAQTKYYLSTFELNPPYVIPTNRKRFRVVFDALGLDMSILRVVEVPLELHDLDQPAPIEPFVTPPLRDRERYASIPHEWTVLVEAVDEAHARKIAIDARAQFDAVAQGIA